MDRRKPRYVLYYILLLLFTAFVMRQNCTVKYAEVAALTIILQWAAWIIIFTFCFRNLVRRFHTRTASFQEYVFILVTIVFLVVHLKALNNAHTQRNFPKICEFFGAGHQAGTPVDVGEGSWKIKRPPGWFATPVP